MLPSARSLEGKPVPKVTFKTRADNRWQDVTTDADTMLKYINPKALEAHFGARKAA